MSSALDKNWLRFTRDANGLILDCGCGIGLWKASLESRGKVVGVDIDKNYLKQALYENMILCSATHLPFDDGTFNFVWAAALIEHVKDDCIDEIQRVGKHVVITTPNNRSPLDIVNRVLRRPSWFSSPSHVRAYSGSDLRKYGRVYGCSCGLPKRSFWQKFIPQRFWLLFPRLSHSFLLEILPKVAAYQ